MRRFHENNQEWKYFYLNLAEKKIKNEENYSASDDNCSERGSDESMHVMLNEDDIDTEPEETDEDTCTSEVSMPESLDRNKE